MNFDDDFKKEIELKASFKNNETPSKNNDEVRKTDKYIVQNTVEKINNKLPNITKNMLPNEIGNWVSDICERIETPFEVGAVNAICLIGNLIGNRVAIKPKKWDYNYIEYPNLWGAVVGSPSMKKTPVFNEISKSLDRIQQKENNKYQDEVKHYDKDMNNYNILQKQHRKEIEKALKDSKAIPEFTIEQPKKPKRIVHFTQDATIEAITTIIEDNPKGLLTLRDELSGFLKTLDKVGNEEYRSFYLSGWSSTSYLVERMSRPSQHIPKLTLGVIGNIQPSMIKKYVHEVLTGYKADGLLPRFQMLVFSENLIIKGVDRIPNTSARDQFDNVIKYILANEEFEGTDQNNYNKQPYYSYSSKAQNEYDKWYVSNANESKDCDSEALESHLSKYPKLINGLSLIFHICELSKGYDRQGDYNISLENFSKAKILTDVLKQHAIKLYSTYEIEEQKKEYLYIKIENKIIELSRIPSSEGGLPLTYGQISQKVAKAKARDVEDVAKDISVTRGKKVIKLK